MQLLPPAVIFAGQYGELRALPPNLAGEKRQEREWLKLQIGGAIRVDGEWTEEEKTGSVIHPSNFSAVIAPMHWGLL